MRRLTREQFNSRYTRRPPAETYARLYNRDLHIEDDADVTGLVEGSLHIHGSAHVVLSGLVNGSVTVDRDAVLWVEGLVEGRINVAGAAYLNGACSAKGDRAAVVYDPTAPADSQTEPAP